MILVALMRNFIYATHMKVYNKIKKRYLNTRDLPFTCMYCGEPANEREHVYPRTLFGEDTPKVWSCGECNRIAGAKLFDTIEEKRDYIHKQLVRRYSGLLSSPEWDIEELKELKGSIKKDVLAFRRAQIWIKSRLAWKTSPLALVVMKHLQDKDIGKNSAETLAGLDITQKRELRLLLRFENQEQELLAP